MFNRSDRDFRAQACRYDGIICKACIFTRQILLVIPGRERNTSHITSAVMEDDLKNDVEMKQGKEESDEDTVVEENEEAVVGGLTLSVVDSPHNKDDASTHNRDGEEDQEGLANSGNDTTDSEEVAAGSDEATSTSTTTAIKSATKKSKEQAPAADVALAPVEPIRPKPKIRIKLTLPGQAKRKLPLAAKSGEGPAAEEDSSFARPAKSFKKSLPLSKHVTGTGES
jgi:hypothetical protein